MASKRVDQLKKRIQGMRDSEDIMIEILDVFHQTDIIPMPGKYYTFVYKAKTNGIVYDQHPLVAVTDVEKWGFKAINFHWGESRNYTWFEIAGFLHEVEPNEISYLRTIDYAKFITMPP